MTSGYYYVFYLMLIMVIAGAVKDSGYLQAFFRSLQSRIKSKRAVVALVSLFSGILPIPGRVAVSAGILQSVAPTEKGPPRSKFGIIDYLSTHHYYLWSPLEKTIIIPMAVLGLSYSQMLSYTGGLLAITLSYIFAFIFVRLKESDIELHIQQEPEKTRKKIKPSLKHINWSLLGVVTAVIWVSGLIKEHSGAVKTFLENNPALDMATLTGFLIVSTIAFLASFAMGSSSKYAGIVALLGVIYGVEYLTWFIAIEYSGYLISPMHKCLHIGRMYFGTPWKDYLQVIGSWIGLMIAYGLLIGYGIPLIQ